MVDLKVNQDNLNSKFCEQYYAICLQYIYIYTVLRNMPSIYKEDYSESTEPIDAVNILPLARFEPTTSATPPSTTPDADATNCATETSPKKDVQEALILTTTDAVHVVYWFFLYICRIKPKTQIIFHYFQKIGIV